MSNTAKKIDGIYLRIEKALAKPENKKRLTLGTVIFSILGIIFFLAINFYNPFSGHAAPSMIVDGTSNLGTAYTMERKVVRTTSGANGNRTFAMGYTGSALVLYYSDDPEAGSPTWSTVGTLITTTTHFIGSLVWDETNNVIYVTYGRDAAADAAAADTYFRRISNLGGSPPTMGAQAIALDATTSINYTHPIVEIAGDAGTNKVFVLGSRHNNCASCNADGFSLRSGTINADAPTWDTVAHIQSAWTLGNGNSLLGVSRMNTGKLVVSYANTTGVLAKCHLDSADAQTTANWDQLNCSTDGATTVSSDVPAARGVGSVVGMPSSDVVWFSWLDASSDINTRRWNGSALDTEMTPVALAANNVGPALTTDATTLWLAYIDSFNNLVYQSRAVSDGTNAWSGSATTLENHAESLVYPSLVKKIYQGMMDVVYTTVTNSYLRHMSVDLVDDPPTLTVTQPDGTGDTVNVGDSYDITYDLADPDTVVTAAFYYDADSSGFNGTAISGACATAAEGTGATCSWNTTGVTPGSYYVYGMTSVGGVSDYSPGQITINAVNSPPTINIDNPAFDTDITETANYTIQYDLADSDSTATVDFYYETDGNGAGGTVISVCQNQAEGTNATCQFTPPSEGMSLSTYYYIYGVASDGVNPDVTDVSSGRIRRNAAPTLAITQPDGTGDTVNQGQSYTIYFDLADTDSIITVDLYYDVDGSGLNGTAISGCANLAEGTNQTCSWNTTGVSLDTYYIYGRDVNDTVNSEVTDYSPGEVTIISANSNPDTPTNLGPAGYIDTAGWMNDNTPTFNFDITDPDTADQVKYRIQIDDTAGFGSVILDYQPSGFGAEGTYNYTVGQAGSYAVGSQSMTLSDNSVGGGYYWQVKAIDDDSAESAYEEAGVNSTIDFRVDATAPSGGSVTDGANTGSLTQLDATLSGFDANVSGLNKYEYGIGTTAGGTDTKTWTDNGASTTITATGLNLQTSVTYYFTVRATDNATNVGTAKNSAGQMVLPTLSFTLSSNSISFDNLNAGNSYHPPTKNHTLGVTTNAANGYSIYGYTTQVLTSLQYPTKNIVNYAGTWAAPTTWSGYGFGYTSSDNLVQGSDRFGSGTKYCGFSQTQPGNIVADHTAVINGSTGEADDNWTITYQVATSNIQEASTYQTTGIYIVVPNF